MTLEPPMHEGSATVAAAILELGKAGILSSSKIVPQLAFTLHDGRSLRGCRLTSRWGQTARLRASNFSNSRLIASPRFEGYTCILNWSASFIQTNGVLMPLSLRCPKCNAKFRIARAIEPDEEVDCPKCGIAFSEPSDDDRPPTPSRSRQDAGPESPGAKSGGQYSGIAFSPPPGNDDRPSTRSRSGKKESPSSTEANSRRPDDDDFNNRVRKSGSGSSRDDDRDEDRPSGELESNSRTILALVAGAALFLLVMVGGIVAAVAYVVNNRNEVAADVQRDAHADNDPVQAAPAPVIALKPAENGAPHGGESSSAGAAAPSTVPVPSKAADAKAPSPPDSSERVRPNPAAPAKVEMPPEVEAKIRNATVYVEVSQGNRGACGSGFIVRSSDEAAYIVTNNHVIAADLDEKDKQPAGPPGRPGVGQPPWMPIVRPPRIGPIGPPNRRPEPKREKAEIIVMLYRGTPQQVVLDASVVAADADADLAVLRIAGGRNYPAPIDLATEDDLVEFSPVRIFGYPNGKKELVVSRGVASQLVRNAHGELTDVQLNINPTEVTHGNSGGPVVDAAGRLVGVTVAGIGEKNVGWAIPATKLAHMFHGSVNGGVLYSIRQKGFAVALAGESWRLDRQNRVESRSALDIVIDANAPNQGLPPNEYHVAAILSDPLKKIRSVQVLYVVEGVDSVVRDGTGWGPLRNARKADMTFSDRSAQVVLNLPESTAEDVYAVQFAYVDGEGKTKYTQPHEVRFSFPKSLKAVTVVVTGIKDEGTKRYVCDALRECVVDGQISTVNVPDGVKATVEPVEDPKAFAERIPFGKPKVTGWQIAVSADGVAAPLPVAAEVDRSLADLNGNANQVRINAADRLAKCYVPLPDRRAEVAKALVALVVEQDFWASRAAINALKVWGGPEIAKDLATVLEKADSNGPQGDLIGLIAPYKSPACARALAKRLSSGFDRGLAAAALKAIGPAAEKAVFPVLEGKESWTVREACLVLNEIGTTDAIAPLQALIDRQPDFVIAPTAKEALAAVKARSSSPVKPTDPVAQSAPAAPSAPSPAAPAPSASTAPSKPSSVTPEQQATNLPGWGVAMDPMKDCEFAPEKDRLTMKIVASGHQKPGEKINLNAPRVMREVEGDFTVKVKVLGEFSPGGRSTNPKSIPWHGAGIIVWNDVDNYIRLERAASNRGGRVIPYTNFEEFKGGDRAAGYSGPGRDADCWLRMERKGKAILCAVSFDGDDWKELKPMQVEWPAKLKIGLQATTTSSLLPWSVSFEEYELKAANAKKVE